MIIRINKKDDPYVRLDKYFINDDRLSLKAVGIMTHLLSKPDGWHVRPAEIANSHPDGITGVRTGIKELKDCGYMKPIVTRDPKTGKILKWDYDVYERPLNENLNVAIQESGFQQVGFQQVGNRTHNNKGLLLMDDLTKNNGNHNNNSIKKNSNKKTIITVPIKHKRKFNKIKQDILNLGWVGSLDEIIKFHNQDPEFVRGWVERISNINIDNPAGLLRKSLRLGEHVPTKDEVKSRRKKYLDDPLSEFIEKESV